MKINPEYVFLFDIRNYCNDYLSNKISVELFQSNVQEHLDNWGNEITKPTQSIIGEFICNIETDRFMYDEPERSEKIIYRINNLLEWINKFLPDDIDKLMENYKGEYL